MPLEVECVLPMQEIDNSNSIPIHAENDSTKQLYSSLSQPRYIFFCFIHVCNPKFNLSLPFVLYRPSAQELNSNSEAMEVMYSLIELEEDSEPIEATTSFIVFNGDVTTLPVAEANNLVGLPIENLDISKEETVVSLENNERQTITNSVPKNTQKRKYQIKKNLLFVQEENKGVVFTLSE